MILIRKVTTADSTAVTGQVKVRKFYWKSPATIADTCVIQDGAGNEVVTLVCEVALQSQVVDFDSPGLEFKSTGIKVSTLASGNLYYYG